MTEPTTDQTIRMSFKPATASWLKNPDPKDIIVYATFDSSGGTNCKSSHYDRALNIAKKLSLEDQHRLRKAVNNRPRISHVYSTLIQFFILFFPLATTPQEIGSPRLCDRGGAAAGQVRKVPEVRQEKEMKREGGGGQSQ